MIDKKALEPNMDKDEEMKEGDAKEQDANDFIEPEKPEDNQDKAEDEAMAEHENQQAEKPDDKK